MNAVDKAGWGVLRRQIGRVRLLAFFAAPSPCQVGMKAGSGSHFRAREPGMPGHAGRLMQPSCAKPDVARGRSAAADAEAVTRPNMRVVPKTCLRRDAGQDQTAAIGAGGAQSEDAAARGVCCCASRRRSALHRAENPPRRDASVDAKAALRQRQGAVGQGIENRQPLHPPPVLPRGHGRDCSTPPQAGRGRSAGDDRQGTIGRGRSAVADLGKKALEAGGHALARRTVWSLLRSGESYRVALI